jgi:radical SAM superfamily enzyme YgiQ (UPF0313 family)
MERLFCISAGQLIVKKSDTVINKKNRYLNYGLLSLVTTLKYEGWNTIQIQGLFDNPSKTVKKCIEFGFSQSSTLPFLISIPSFYAISWVNEFIFLIKEINPKIKIIIGGRWVIADRTDFMQSLVPAADIIVTGLADTSINKIVESCLPTGFAKIKIKNIQTNNLSLDYKLLHERELYQPSLEVSRGCGMGCAFCQEKNEPLQSLKTAGMVADDAKSILLPDSLNKMNLYFEASMFVPVKSWVKDLIFIREKKSLTFNWRAESRVDTINLRLVKDLAMSGLRILDLGLESASHSQLIRMNKTKNPKLYLERASKLLKACHDYGIFVKINILLFAGETHKTISETMEWLRLHKDYIKGVSVGPVIVFGWELDTDKYLKELQFYGASKSHIPTIGIQHLNLSNEINYNESIDISKNISNTFMTVDDYFYLKSFSYFSRDYKYENYILDVFSDEN